MAKDELAKKESITIAVYKANLHCPKCAHDIKKPLSRTPGVHKVDVKHEKGEITVEGIIEVKKIHERLEKWSRKKVEILSQEKKAIEKKETKIETIRTTKIKAYMHCDKCEHDLRAKLLKHKGIHNVKTDIKSQTVVIEGTIEAEKIVTYMQKRARKHAEIISEPSSKGKVEKKVETKEKVTVEVTKIVEFEERKKVEAQTKEGEVPYFVHYVYAPQLFSDENPNACLVM
ncbi:heavy metal-associated isoprenylated plant protein 4 [Cynara cardunculus var. scolymus]|uniref:Heavy metal-associated domain, HMA n=1 Tax=Cynara cardunculus var. scolymus TaxID=59895 RepID=A0A103XEL5_CYNCS|nr:heavy metal-associated isoprenylated plant protein 4 [Cynara cardunculus var. scolymus]KVH89253.1 Heavy metal-associated domain, HMA [Cynara cardunculus var. scolymus]